MAEPRRECGAQEVLGEEGARLDRLPEPHLVGEERAAEEEGEHLARRLLLVRETEEARGPLEREQAIEGLGVGERGGHEGERGVRGTAGRVSEYIEAGDVGCQSDGDLQARGRGRGKVGLGRGWRRSEAYR